MSGCCEVGAQINQKKTVLITVLIINAVMFVAQLSAAMVGHSSALLADSMDMLGDVFAYAVSLYAVHKGAQWIRRASLFKGTIIGLFGLAIIIDVVLKIFIVQVHPAANIMLVFSLLGLIANGSCFYLLTRHRHQDINMHSTWICARNDVIGNLSVLLAAGLIYVFNSRWPDIIIGGILAIVLLTSALKIIGRSLHVPEPTR